MTKTCQVLKLKLKIKKNKTCEVCGKKFLRTETFKNHIEIVDEQKKSIIEKLDCSLYKYVVSIHEGKKQFQCNIFDSKYTSKHGLLYDVTRVHDKIDKNFQCNICGNTFTLQNGLQYHLKSVHEGEKHFSCETCPKNFTSKQGLNYHIEKCTSSYESKQDLKVHTEAV